MTPVPPPAFMPPAPRDAQEPTFSEMVPLLSHKIKLQRSWMLYVVIALAVLSVLGFKYTLQIGQATDDRSQAELIAAFRHVWILGAFVLLGLIQTGLYVYAKPSKPFPYYWLGFLTTAAILFPLGDGIQTGLFFKTFLPLFSHAELGPAPWFTSFLHGFLGPGLREELCKAVFILATAAMSFRLLKNPGMPRSKMFDLFRLTGPLDGVLLGIFAGGGFTFIETGWKYVPETVVRVAHDTDLGMGLAQGLALLIPRVIEGLAGHMGYSAVFGYFIGLAVIRPKAKWRLMLMGYLLAAALHGAWDGVPGALLYDLPPNAGREDAVHLFSMMTNINFALATLSAIIAMAMLLKARQLESLITGKVTETTGSIVVERPIGMAPFAPPPYAGARVAPPFAPHLAPVAPPMAPQGGAAMPPPYAPAPVAAPPGLPPGPMAAFPQQAPAGPLALDVGGVKFPMRDGASFDLAAEPALAGKGAGVKGVVVAHPSRANVFGLRNTGAAQWTATLRDGSTQVIDREKNIRLAPGVRIDFGGGLAGLVTSA